MIRSAQTVPDVLNRIVRRLVEHCRPERIILFGSHATGSSHPDSDLDLLVVLDTDEMIPDRLDRVRELLADVQGTVPLDVIVLTPEEVESRRRRGDAFLDRLLDEGQVFHAA